MAQSVSQPLASASLRARLVASVLLGCLPQAVLERLLELLQHRLLDHDVLVIEVINNVLVAALGVNVDDDGLDRRVALDQDTCRRGARQLHFLRVRFERQEDLVAYL